MSIAYTVIEPAPVPEESTAHRVRMRDGVHLAADFYRADTDGETAPTILIRLPYDKAGAYTFIPDIAKHMTARGYHVVAQDVRGKFRSEGESLLFVNEAYDGYDTIEWITRQDWSDGSVAMWGDSYYGYTQWAAVSTAHPALRAIAPRVTGTGLGEYPQAVEGASQRDVEMSIILLYPLTHFHSRDTYEWEPDWTTRPYIRDLEAFQAAVGRRSASFDLWFPNPVILRRFPSGSPFDAPAVPVLTTIGWWDNCAPWSWRDHAELAARQNWAHNEFVLIESIDHENNLFTRGDDGELRRLDFAHYLDPALDFFDVFVRGLAPAASIPKVRWNLAGTEGYRVSTSWPPAGVRELNFHLTVNNALASEAPTTSEAVEWVHDPDDLVPSQGEDPFAFLEVVPDERDLQSRSDVVTFVAPSRPDEVNLVGLVTLRANVESTGPNMDVFARLYDRSPDGRLTRIARGQVHVPDATRPVTVTIDMGHVGYRMCSGHQLQLHLCSSDFPEFIPQPGTGECPWTAQRVQPNTQRLWCGGPQGATLTLGMLDEPGEAFDQRGDELR